jgi:hypothetical protein
MKLHHSARFKIALTYLGWTRIHLCLIHGRFSESEPATAAVTAKWNT